MGENKLSLGITRHKLLKHLLNFLKYFLRKSGNLHHRTFLLRHYLKFSSFLTMVVSGSSDEPHYHIPQKYENQVTGAAIVQLDDGTLVALPYTGINQPDEEE